jgi:DNA polymerase III delta prime subunit
MIHNDLEWVEKYRPKRVADVVLPDRLKNMFQSMVDKQFIPTLILAGGPGVGKTTIAMAMLDELGCDWIKLNGSLEGRTIDVLRGRVTEFASTVSMEGGRKYIILDEADYSNPQTVQPALRGFIEEYSNNCGFIFTCNFKSKIIGPISESRCTTIEFKFTKDEIKTMIPQFYKRAVHILKSEGVEFDKISVGTLIKKFAPDWRKIIGTLQAYGQSGKIDSGVLVTLKETELVELIRLLKEKDFNGTRTWVTENSVESSDLFEAFYKHMDTYFADKASKAKLILTLGEYQYSSAFAANQEINTMAFLVKVMMESNFK